MPKRSPYRIALSDEERRILEAQARRYTLPYRDVIRAQMVLWPPRGSATIRSRPQPNDFGDLGALGDRLRAFERHCEQIAKPFAWAFTRRDLEALMAKVDSRQSVLRPAA